MAAWYTLVVSSVFLVCTATSLDYPYSVAFESYVTQVEACASASGFSFHANTMPTAYQVSKMCGDPNCGFLLSNLLTNLKKNGTNANSITMAHVTFGWPMLNFCWYSHLPQDPCPTKPFLPDFFERFKHQVDTCATEMGFSFAEPNMTLLQEHVQSFLVLRTPCSRVCHQVSQKIYYATVYTHCHQKGVNDTNQTLQTVSAAVDMYCWVTSNDWPAGIYQYQADWPVPTVLSDDQIVTDDSISKDNDEDDSSTTVVVDPSINRVPRPTKDRSILLPQTLPLLQSDVDEEGTNTNIPLAVQIETSGVTMKPPSSTTPVVTPGTTSAPIDPATHRAPNHDPLYGVSIAAAATLSVIAIVIIRRRRRRLSDIKTPDHSTQPLYAAFHDQLSPPAESMPSDQQLLSPDSMELMLSSMIPGLQPIPVDALKTIRLIGTGGHGVVHLVRDTRDGRLLASKRLAKNQVSKDRVAAFVQEIQLVSTLDHPCVVSFVGASWTNRVDVQALFEYMEGGDLRTFLDKTPVESWSIQKVEIAIDIADALAYVHTALATPIVHRDLKSRNVLLNKSCDHAKLSDFGVARNVSQNLSMTTGVGTSRWLAPEVIVGGGDYNAACDIYSFGVVLSELDTHRVPFSDRGGGPDAFMPEIAILSMVGLDGLKPSFSDSCPSSFLELAEQCLSREPNKRPTASELSERLQIIRWEILKPAKKRRDLTLNVHC